MKFSRWMHTLTLGVKTTKNQVRNLGVILETDLSFSSHVKAVTKSAFHDHLKNIARIRCFVSSQDLEKLVHGFITSRVDYCNILLPKKTIRQLQLIQNTAAGFWPEPEHLNTSHQSSGPYTGFQSSGPYTDHQSSGPYTGFQLHLGLILKYFYSFINHSMT